MQIRLLGTAIDGYSQSYFIPMFPGFMFVILAPSLAGTVLLIDKLPLVLYLFLPASVIGALAVLVYLLPLMASVLEESQASVHQAKVDVSQLKDADRNVLKYSRRLVWAQRPIGGKVSSFGYVSVDTVQEVIDQSVSYCLLIIDLVKVPC